jgi:antitoxin ParD1/3/4
MNMARSLNISLTEPMRKFVDAQAGEKGIYATPSEYLRALVRQDMEDHGTVSHVMIGLDDVRNARFSEKSILDIHDEND